MILNTSHGEKIFKKWCCQVTVKKMLKTNQLECNCICWFIYGPRQGRTCLQGLRITQALTSLRIHAVRSAPLLFTFCKVPYVSWAGWFESHFVGNSEDRFCPDTAHIWKGWWAVVQLVNYRMVFGSSLAACWVTVWCPYARHLIHCLELVQPRKTHPELTEKLLTGA